MVSRKLLMRGFTVMEMLVVISIIGFLSSIIILNVKTGRERARDAIRVVDVDQLKKALIAYSLDHDGQYPLTLAGLTQNPTSDYISTLPKDPLDKTDYYYQAYRGTNFQAPGQECHNAAQKCIAYHLGADFEIAQYGAYLTIDDDVNGSAIRGDENSDPNTSCSNTTGRYCYDFIGK